MLDLFWGRSDKSVSTRSSTVYLFNILKFVGIIPTKKWKPLYYFYSVIVVTSVNLYLPLTFICSFFLFFDFMTTSQFLTSLQVIVNLVGIPNKVLVIKCYMKNLREAEEIMETLDGRCIYREDYERIKRCTKYGNRVVFFYSSMFLVCSVLLILSSVLMGQPPYSVYMAPLDWRNSTWELIVQSVIEFIMINYACLEQSTADGYASAYVYILRTHMQILVDRVRRLGSVSTKTKEMNYQELVACVRDHQNILRLYDKIRPVISATLFIQFVLTASILVTTMINFLIFADRTAQIASLVYFVAVLSQIAPCCYQATCLLSDCDELPLAILQCEWWQQDKRFRKMLIFFMHRSQRPLALSAMKIFDITLNTNLSIAKFSFSLYTLIESLDLGNKFKN